MKKIFLLSIITVLVSFSSSFAIEWNWIPIPGQGQQPGINSNAFNNPTTKTPIYDASDCTGSIVGGKCMGTINKTSTQKYCYGSVINGKCMGYVGY